MGYSEKISGHIQDGFLKRIADDIVQGIDKVYAKPDKSSRRWMWELVQNAKDIPNQFGKVTINIRLESDKLIFAHNANPFSSINLTNLIMQVSSKYEDEEDEEDDVTGKFGTGFLVTHLLSKKLYLSGILYDEGESPVRFSRLEIDRSADNSRDLKESIDTTLVNLRNLELGSFTAEDLYFQNRKESDLDTVFEYPFSSERALIRAQKGIDDLVNTLPLTLVFVERIKHITVEDQVRNRTFEFELSTQDKEGVGYFAEVQIDSSDDTLNETQFFWVNTEKNGSKIESAVAFKISAIGENFEFEKFSNNTPSLYRDFPLIGSEEFPVPAIFNSHFFYPDETRSSLMITDEEGKKDQKNLSLIKACYDRYSELIAAIPQKVQLGLHSLVNVSQKPELTGDWFEEEVYKPYIEFLYRQKLIYNGTNKIPLSEAYIPFGSRVLNEFLTFYDICVPIIGRINMPLKKEMADWHNAARPAKEYWPHKVSFELEDLIEKIEGKSVDELNQEFEFEDFWSWCKNFLKFVSNVGKTEVLEEHDLVPNATGQLKKIDELYVNKKVSEELLDIYEALNEDYRPHLIDSRIILPFDGHQSINSKELGEKINTAIKDMDLDEIESKEPLHALLSIFPSEEASKRKTFLKYFSDYFGFGFEPIVIPDLVSDLNFDVVWRTSIRILFKDIQSLGNIENLTQQLDTNYDKAVIWLGQLLQEIKNDSKHEGLLSEYSVFPNQYGQFLAKEDVYNDGEVDKPLPSQLLDFLKSFNANQDWRDELLHDGIGVGLENSRKLEELTKEIIIHAKRVFNDWSESQTNLQGDLEEQVAILMSLIRWTTQSLENKELTRLHMSWLDTKKPIINTMRIEDPEIKEAMYGLIDGDNAKIKSAAKIAEKMNVEQLEQLEQLTSNNSVEDLKKASDLMKQFTPDEMASLSSIAKEVGKERMMEIAKGELEKKRDFQFKKEVGDRVENEFSKAFKEIASDFEIRDSEGKCDFIISKAGSHKQYLIELKSIGKDWRYIKMAQSQANEAVRNNNYALCVIRRPEHWNAHTGVITPEEYLKSHMKAVTNIGHLLQSPVKLANQFSTELLKQTGEIGVEFTDDKYHFTVKESIYMNGKSFQQLVEHISKRLTE